MCNLFFSQHNGKGYTDIDHIVSGFIPISDETNIVQLSRTMEDILTAGIVSSVEVVPWLLTTLVHRLMDTVAQLSPLVPQDFYLPAPPLYCPQPTETNKVTLDVVLELLRIFTKKNPFIVKKKNL